MIYFRPFHFVMESIFKSTTSDVRVTKGSYEQDYKVSDHMTFFNQLSSYLPEEDSVP